MFKEYRYLVPLGFTTVAYTKYIPEVVEVGTVTLVFIVRVPTGVEGCGLIAVVNGKRT